MKSINNFLKDLFALRGNRDPITFFGTELPVKHALMIIASIVMLEVLTVICSLFFIDKTSIYSIYIIASIMVISLAGLIAVFYLTSKLLINASSLYLLIILIFSGTTFGFEKFVLNSELFPEFTLRTTVLLYAVFTGLSISIFRKYLPGPVLAALLPVLITGFFVTIPFTISMLPLMLFSWIFIFAGIGIFPYSPVFAMSAFAIASVSILNTLKISRHPKYYRYGVASIILSTVFIMAYAGIFFYRWKSISDTFVSSERTGANAQIDGDLSPEIRAAKYLTADHVLEIYMKTDHSDGIKSMFDILSKKHGEYDIAGFTASIIFSNYPSPKNELRENLMNILYRINYTAYESIWGSKNTYTSDISTRIQLFPAIRTAYVESILTVRNSSDMQEEAIYTIHVPEGSAASRLGLWINGREETARLTLKSNARKAYNQIVNVESRDPSLLEWKDGSRYRLKVFPVPGGGFRTVRVGFTVPLKFQNNSAVFNPVRIEGPGTGNANNIINVDLFTDTSITVTAENIFFTDNLVSDGEKQSLSYEGIYKHDYTIRMDNIGEPKGMFYHDGFHYSAVPARHIAKSVEIRHIFLVLDNSKKADEWYSLYGEILRNKPENSKLYIVGERLFYSNDLQKIKRFISESRSVNFNLFPYYQLKDPEHSFIISAESKQSIPYSELNGTEFYKKSESFFADACCPVLTAVLGENVPSYIQSLKETDRILIGAQNKDDVMKILKNQEIHLIEKRAGLIPIPGTGFSVQKLAKNHNSSGLENYDKDINSHLMRLYTYGSVQSATGKKKFFSDADHPDLYRMVRKAGIVSQVSSLIVLESEHDYRRFGITEKQSSDLESGKLASTNLADSPLGTVPEPEEYALMIILLSVFAFLYREKLLRVLHLLRPKNSAGFF